MNDAMAMTTGTTHSAQTDPLLASGLDKTILLILKHGTQIERKTLGTDMVELGDCEGYHRQASYE
jgi:hypothetical protein